MCEQRNAALVRATLGEKEEVSCVRLAKVLGDSFGAGAGVGVPLPLMSYLWASTSGLERC